MPYDYEAELEAWRARMAAKPVARWVRLDGFIVKRRPVQTAGWVEYDGEQMPRYEDESQEAA